MSKNIKSKFEQEIDGWSDFVSECKKQVAKDKTKFKTAYLPSAEICSKPKFCLIAMEPSLDENASIEKIEKQVNEQGRKIFFPPIVSYCVWRYLCGKKYNFHITDLDKGVKSVKLAKETQKERYKIWMPLLERELELLGNPITISIGKGLYGIMEDYGLEACSKICHYTFGSGATHWKRKYELIKQSSPEKILYPEKELSELTSEEQENLKFLKKKLKELGSFEEKTQEWKKKSQEADEIIFESLPTKDEIESYTRKIRNEFGDPRFENENIEEIISNDFKRPFSNDKKKLLALYRYKLIRIRECN